MKFKRLRKKSKRFSELSTVDEGDESEAATSSSSSIVPNESHHRKSTNSPVDSTEMNKKVEKLKELEQDCWTKSVNIEEKSRGEEFDSYLEDLLL